MKLNHYYKLQLLIKFILIFCFVHANANENINEKVKKLTLELRCMTCQNQSIHDSESDFANDIKKVITNKLKKFDQFERVINFLNSVEYDKQEYANFFKFIKQHDEYRKQNFNYTFKEFANHLKETNV